jgi:hypothetical protein
MLSVMEILWIVNAPVNQYDKAFAMPSNKFSERLFTLKSRNSFYLLQHVIISLQREQTAVTTIAAIFLILSVVLEPRVITLINLSLHRQLSTHPSLNDRITLSCGHAIIYVSSEKY